jgi:hypothetical protein
MNLILVTIATFLINIPFGYWRANVRKKSLQSVLAIHIPVPFVIFMRIYSEIGFDFYTYPIIVTAFFLGQFTGVKFYQFIKRSGFSTSSCLVMDLYKNLNSN